jgi:hypothetical protein
MRRAANRRPMFTIYEQDLAERTLLCAGNHYGKSELVSASTEGYITLGWPQGKLAVQTPDMLEMQLEEVSSGLKSYLMLLSEYYDVDRDTALEIVEQMKTDVEDVEKINPDMAAVTTPQPPPELPSPDEAKASLQVESQPAAAGNGKPK